MLSSTHWQQASKFPAPSAWGTPEDELLRMFNVITMLLILNVVEISTDCVSLLGLEGVPKANEILCV